MATRPFLVVIFARETPFFGDEILSRRLFEPGNTHFWRRNPFSSSFFGWKLTFLATKPVLVVFFWLETHFSGDEILSRRLFEAENSLFWRRDPFSSSLLPGKPPFSGDEILSRRLFEAENSLFWRRDPFSSSLLPGKPPFLATRPFLVVIFARETPFFGDEAPSRH
ncbi:hypothetical protein NSS91_03055 [Caldifermentibacillus hisashii]|uniref:hypothetical protein n=1 Tax=Caldifermentibacillus hisashii TaxID=996558 RepID=UPI0031FC28FD